MPELFSAQIFYPNQFSVQQQSDTFIFIWHCFFKSGISETKVQQSLIRNDDTPVIKIWHTQYFSAGFAAHLTRVLRYSYRALTAEQHGLFMDKIGTIYGTKSGPVETMKKPIQQQRDKIGTKSAPYTALNRDHFRPWTKSDHNRNKIGTKLVPYTALNRDRFRPCPFSVLFMPILWPKWAPYFHRKTGYYFVARVLQEWRGTESEQNKDKIGTIYGIESGPVETIIKKQAPSKKKEWVRSTGHYQKTWQCRQRGSFLMCGVEFPILQQWTGTSLCSKVRLYYLCWPLYENWRTAHWKEHCRYCLHSGQKCLSSCPFDWAEMEWSWNIRNGADKKQALSCCTWKLFLWDCVGRYPPCWERQKTYL